MGDLNATFVYANENYRTLITRPENLIGYWSFDEGAGFVSSNRGTAGTAHDVNLLNGATFSGTVKKFGNSALRLPSGSTGAYAQVATALNLGGDLTKANFTLSTWFRNLYPVGQWRTLSRGSNRHHHLCLLYTSPSPRDATLSRMPSSA